MTGLRLLISVLFLPVAACGKDGENSTGKVRYYLEQAASSTTSNALILEADGEFKPQFSLSGEGFTADTGFGIQSTFQDRTVLRAETFGEVTITINLFQENGKPYLTDTLVWKSSGEVPPKPEPYFSEIVSADAYVYLVFPKSSLRGKNTKEAWIAGDLAESPEGSYQTIPSDDQVLVKLSDGDGTKVVRVKYRNIFGAHSEEVSLSIERKSLGPTDCKAIPVATKTASGKIRTRIQAVNEGPLYFRVTGDVALEKDYAEFDSQVEEWISLSGTEGVKHLFVAIKDQAGNACPEIPLTITYDRNYLPGRVTVEGDLIWTDQSNIVVLPNYDQLVGDDIEMYISGGVVDDAKTFQWLPYAERIPVILTPTNGTRHVIVQFRRESTVMLEVEVPIFLRPYVLIQGSASPYQIMAGEILGADSMTITGCAETYAGAAYQASFPCTPLSASPFTVNVTYHLKDGTNLTRSGTR